MFDITVTLRSLVAALLILAAGATVAQEGWRDFAVGDTVVVHRKDSRRIEGKIVEIDDEHILLAKKFGKVDIPRGEVARLAAKKKPATAGTAADDPPEDAGAALPIEFVYGPPPGKTFKGFVGSKLTVTVGSKTKKNCILVGVEDDQLVVTRHKLPLRYPLRQIVEILLVGGPAPSEAIAGPGASDDTPDIPDSDEWPPAVGRRVKVLLEGEKEWLFGPVLSLDEEGESFELGTPLGAIRCEKGSITSWVALGSSAGYLQLARLIRHYGTEINPDWAKEFLPTPGLSRARDDEQLLAEIRVKPSPQFRIKSLPVTAVGAKGPKFERERMLEYIKFQRSRYLAIAESQIGYFYDLNLFESEKEVKKVFRELKREKPGKESEVDTSFIGTSISNRLREMYKDVTALKNTRASAEEIAQAEAAFAVHKDMASRFTEALEYFEKYRKLSFATDEQLDKDLDEYWRDTNKQVRRLIGGAVSPLSSKVESHEMPRPTTLILDLSESGRDALMKDLTDLYAGAKTVPYDDDEWLFNRALRGIVASIMPQRSSYRFSLRSSGSDVGFAPVYYLIVYRFGAKEICRLALFRIEPELHIRMLLHDDKLLLGEAEEWIRR